MFNLFYAFIWLISWLPLPVLYIFSDFAFIIIAFLIGYRKKIVRQNLERSFPNKTKKELRKIELRFYRFFCDVFIETIYEMHCSKSEILKRMDFGNIDILLEQYAKGKSPLLMTSHYGNWEWASALSLLLPSESPLYGIYKKVNNKKFDLFMQEMRKKFTGENVETQDLVRTMLRLKKEGKLAMFGMISDQSPWIGNIHHWMNFLNQDTPVIIGTEQLAKKFDYPVFLMHIHRIKRGYYKFENIPIALEPKLTAEYEITEKYFRLLEEKINLAPEYWLWTHNRWKNTRTFQK
jgi:KDO2-lipid IV(A) lauroyltransferase